MDTDIRGGEYLPVAESFYSLQGEGCNVGKAAYFIRLGGCDVHCPWCDSKSTWDAGKHTLHSVSDIVSEAKQTPAVNIVITGGEPILYPLGILCRELKAQGFNIFLETSGTHQLSGEFDWICLSPKKHRPPLPEVLRQADELKVIVSTPEDIRWGEYLKGNVSERCALLMQPEWNRRDSAVADIVTYIKAHPEWKLSLQTHKLLNIP